MSSVVPTQSPADVKASRSQDDLSITVTWAPSTFEDVGAFFIHKITATPGSSTRRRRQSANPVVQYEPYNETSTVITGLDPREGYSVTVTYVIFGQNGDVTGPDSNPIQVLPSKLKTDIMKCNLEHKSQSVNIYFSLFSKDIFIPSSSSSSTTRSTTSTSMSPPPPTLTSSGGVSIGLY